MNIDEKEQLRAEIIKQEEEKQVTYMVDGEKVTLSIPIIKKYLTPDPNVTNAECMRFLQVCKMRKLFPFTDVHLVKYGTAEASIITKKDFYVERANKHDDYEGMQTGIVVLTKDGNEEEREGGILYEGETLSGGWCRAFSKNKKLPSFKKVPLQEYIGKKGNGETSAQWKKMPCTMIQKVAIKQSLQDLYPNDFTGLNDESELAAIHNCQNENTPDETQKEFKDIFKKKAESKGSIDAEFEEVETTGREVK